MVNSNVIVVDGDGVLFDYNAGVAQLYKEVYADDVAIKLKGAYHAKNEYDFDGAKVKDFQDHIHSFFNKRKMWSRLPVYKEAKEAIDIMVEKGYRVVCLTSMPPEYAKERKDNLDFLNLNVSDVIAVDRSRAKERGISNPKLDYIKNYKPAVFIDDLLKNFLDMEEIKESSETELVWLDNEYADNPNAQYDKNMVHKTIKNLKDFAQSLPKYEEPVEVLEVKKKVKSNA